MIQRRKQAPSHQHYPERSRNPSSNRWTQFIRRPSSLPRQLTFVWIGLSVLGLLVGTTWVMISIGGETHSDKNSPKKEKDDVHFLLRGGNADKPDAQKDPEVQTDMQQHLPSVSTRIVAFYYPWYRTIQHDTTYKHWNHPILPHWEKRVNQRYSTIGQRHDPSQYNDLDIGSTYYPYLGVYSSLNVTVIDSHMVQLRYAGIGVICVSWYPPNKVDSAQQKDFVDTDGIIPLLLDRAKEFGIKVCLHVEPWEGRTAIDAMDAIQVATVKYGSHDAYYKFGNDGDNKKERRPVFFVYDSYRIDANDWYDAIQKIKTVSTRKDHPIPFLYMLWVEQQHESYLTHGGFDGAYTYFASTNMVWGSTPSNWQYMSQYCLQHNKRLSISVGPGYDDTTIRPWNTHSTKRRDGGRYYERMLQKAIEVGGDDRNVDISITSWNEWHEGTQIEPAASGIATEGLRRRQQSTNGEEEEGNYPKYEDGPYMYVNLTRRILNSWLGG